VKSLAFAILVNGPLLTLLLAALVFRSRFAIKALLLAALPIGIMAVSSDEDLTGAFMMYKLLLWLAVPLVALFALKSWASAKFGTVHHG
jgi:hypothetical protein